MGIGLFSGGRRPKREDYHLPSSAEIMNVRSYTSIPPYAFMVWTRTILLLPTHNSWYFPASFYDHEDLHSNKTSNLITFGNAMECLGRFLGGFPLSGHQHVFGTVHDGLVLNSFLPVTKSVTSSIDSALLNNINSNIYPSEQHSSIDLLYWFYKIVIHVSAVCSSHRLLRILVHKKCKSLSSPFVHQNTCLINTTGRCYLRLKG
jgi:hypothetical protein